MDIDSWWDTKIGGSFDHFGIPRLEVSGRFSKQIGSSNPDATPSPKRKTTIPLSGLIRIGSAGLIRISPSCPPSGLNLETAVPWKTKLLGARSNVRY